MQDVTWSQIVGLITMVGAGITFLFSKQTVDALIRLGNWWLDSRKRRYQLEADKQNTEDDRKRKARLMALDEEHNDRGHKGIIRRQDQRITNLEKESEEWRNEASRCQTAFATLSANFTNLQDDYTKMSLRLSKLENDSKSQLVLKILDRIERREQSLKKHKEESKDGKTNGSGD